MFDNLLTGPHIIVLLIVALLIFGPRRLPELGGAVGKTIKEFQKSMNEARSQINSATTLHAEEDKTNTASTTSDRPN